MLLKKNYVLISNKFRGENHLYFNLSEKYFFERKEKIPTGAYVLSVLAMVMTSSLEGKFIHGNFFFLLFLAVFLGILLGSIIQIIDNYYKSQAPFERVELSVSEVEESLSYGKVLLTNQIRFLIVVCLGLLFVSISFYSNRTWMYFLGITIASMVATIIVNLIDYFNRNIGISSLEEGIASQQER